MSRRDEAIKEAVAAARKEYGPLIAIFSSELGTQAMKILEDEFIFQITHTPGDPYNTAFKEGQRALVLFLRDITKTHGDSINEE